MWPRPRCTAASSRSTAVTLRPLRASTSTMPAPIVPETHHTDPVEFTRHCRSSFELLRTRPWSVVRIGTAGRPTDSPAVARLSAHGTSPAGERAPARWVKIFMPLRRGRTGSAAGPAQPGQLAAACQMG